jgi:hypothetical protein
MQKFFDIYQEYYLYLIQNEALFNLINRENYA